MGDHTQMIVYGGNTSIPATGNPSIPKAADIFVSFRGTQGTDFINFRRNLYAAFWPVSLCAQCEVHKGFWRNFISLRPDIYPAILRVAASAGHTDLRNLKYVTTGLSMGGPLALMAAYTLFLVQY